MRKRIAVSLVAVTAGLMALAGGSDNRAEAQDKKAPKHLYGHDLRVRPGGVKNFDEKTPRVGVEVFHDETNRALLVVSQNGSLAVIPAGALGGNDKTCKWLTAHDLNCRKSTEPEFTQQTKKWGVELFRDIYSNKLLYVCESGSVALAPVPGALVTDKGPKWHHGLVPKVRSPQQDRFDDAKKIGLEVFKDENTGNTADSPGVLVYVTETGGIATAPAPGAGFPNQKDIKPPKTLYGLTLRVRGADEPNFTDKTKTFGLEVFEDPNAKVLFYITEQGFVATAPLPKSIPADAKGVTWKGAMALRARKGGEEKFETAAKFGVEVFEDNRTGNLIYITETGAIGVLPKQ